jgi:signal transduction histidine kinase/ActR/RegA family two-component response regulator
MGSIGMRIIISCILPLVLLGGSYMLVLFLSVSADVDEKIDDFAALMSSALMDSSAQALVTGQGDFINKRSINDILAKREIYGLRWLDVQGRVLYQLNERESPGPTSRIRTIAFPVYFSRLPAIDDFNETDLSVDEVLNTAEEHVGSLEIQFNRQLMLDGAYRNFLLKLSYFLVTLLITVVISYFNALRISRALKRVFSYIHRLEKGEYWQRLPVQGHQEELSRLSSSLNGLCETLESNRVQIESEKRALNKAIAEVTEARNDADQSNSWLKKMLRVLSHEMRTPLNAIVGSIDMAISKTDSPFVVKRLENSLSHVNFMLSELENVMDYTQLEDGVGHLSVKSVVDIKETIDILVESYRSQAEQKGLKLASFYLGDAVLLESRYEFDQQRLNQVVINLLSNALKFSRQGQVSVIYRIDLSGEGAQIHVDVADQGIGMTGEQMGLVFNMFQQADLSIEREAGGLGIGLSLCRKYVDILDGVISVSSQEGVGSSFSISFPAKRVSLNNAQTEQTLLADAALERVREVLIVEDNPVNSQILSRLLKRAVPEVSLKLIDDGQIALDHIDSGLAHYDLALVDIHLPHVSGLEVIRALRAFRPSMKIVAATADTSIQNQHACFAAGANLFITKPFRLNKIIEILQDASPPCVVPPEID